MRLINSAISARNWLVREFAVTIATIGSTMIVARARTIRKTIPSMGLGWWNYMLAR